MTWKDESQGVELVPPQDATPLNDGFEVVLPSGHLLRFPNATPGTVVEVAVWNGTEKPDAKTQRIMIGLGTDSAQNSESYQVNSQVATFESEEIDLVLTNKNAKKPFSRKKTFALLTSIAITVGIWASPLIAVRPTVPTTVGIGDSENSLVIAYPVNSLSANETVVSYLDDEKKIVVLGRVNQMTGTDLLIQTDRAFAQTSSDRVIGKVVLVIPFIGALFK